MKNKKGATSLSIVLLVVATIVLVGFALYSFHAKETKSKDFVYQSFGDIYAKEAEINFYLDQGGNLIDIGKLESNDIKIKVEGGEIILEKSYNGMNVIYQFKPKV